MSLNRTFRIAGLCVFVISGADILQSNAEPGWNTDLHAGGELETGAVDRATWDESSAAVAKVALGNNANAVLTLDLIANGGAGNRRDDGVTTGTVSGRGTKIAIEIFATGVRTPLRGLVLRFDFDASLVSYVKAENSAFALSIPEASVGVNLASTTAVTLAPSGFLARAEFETVADVTGREFTIGIERVTLAEGSTSSDALTTARVIAFNATPSTDFDGDGTVGFSDFLALAGSFGSSQGDARYEARFDLDGDGAVGFPDFVAFASQFGKTIDSPQAGFAPADQNAFDRIAVGKQVAPAPHLRLIFLSPGRIREIADGVAHEGGYQFVNTGPNTGRLTYTYDVTGNDPDREKVVIQLTFASATSGTFVSTYTEAGSAPLILRGQFQIVDRENRPPVAVGGINAQELMVGGEGATLDLSESFGDPDGDSLTFSAVSSDTSVVTVGVTEAMLTITPKGAGSSTVTATATDPGGLSAMQTIEVTVTGSSGGGSASTRCTVGLTMRPGEGCQGSGFTLRNDASVLVVDGNVGGIRLSNTRFSGGSVQLNRLRLTRSGNVWTIVSLP